MNQEEPWRPTADQQGIAQDRPFTAGGKDQGRLATRKISLLGTGTPGHIRNEQRDPYTHEAPDQPTGRVVGIPGWEYADEPRTPIRETPVRRQTTHTGTIVRYLDGHSEIHHERAGLVAEMNHPSTDPDTREDIRDEIAHRDAIHLHRWW
jgi:hypothetical protein